MTPLEIIGYIFSGYTLIYKMIAYQFGFPKDFEFGLV